MKPSGILLAAAGFLAALAAHPAAAVPLEVVPRLPAQTASGQTLRLEVTLRPADGRPDAEPRHREVGIAESASFDVSAGSAWEISVEAAGHWSRPEPVLVGPEGQKVVVDVLPAGEVRGTVQVSRGSALPAELTVRFRSVPNAEPTLAPSSQSCPVTEGRFQCVVPAGRLDLRLRARGHVTHYRWGAVVPVGGALDVGTLELQPGASVVGWVEPPDRDMRFEEVTLELAPQSATGLYSPSETERRTALISTGRPNDRGFFEFAGVAPGSYVLVARHQRFAPTRISPVRVEPGAETEVHRVDLQLPATLAVHLDPPRDPWGRVWQVELLRLGEVAQNPTLATSAAASPDGLFRAEGLEPGRYLVQVETGRWGRWHYEELDVAPGMAPYEMRLPVTMVEGTVTLGGEPIKAVVWWGGRHGAVRMPVTSGDDGRFAVMLPKRESWRVEVVSTPLDLHHTIPILDIDPDDDPVRVDIDVPSLALRGEVVDESGRPVPKALVTAEGPPGHFLQIDGDEEGHFKIQGAVPGEWQVAAEGRGLVADTVVVEVGEKASPEPLRLVAKQPRELSGLVVGPAGQGLSGALVVGRLEPHQRALELMLDQQWTEVEGRFTIRLPPGTGTVLLTVFAPGFAVTQVRANPASKEPLVIPVRQVGGTLVLNYDRALDNLAKRHAIKLFSEFELAYRHAIDGWLRLHGQDPDAPGQLVVPMLAPGTYTACLDVEFLASIYGGSAPPGATPRCVSGELAPGGELVLDVPAPPAERSAETAPPPASQ